MRNAKVQASSRFVMNRELNFTSHSLLLMPYIFARRTSNCGGDAAPMTSKRKKRRHARRRPHCPRPEFTAVHSKLRATEKSENQEGKRSQHSNASRTDIMNRRIWQASAVYSPPVSA